MNDIVPGRPVAPATPEADLAQFETALTTAMAHLGLPSEGVIVDITQRRRVFDGFPGVIEYLGGEHRGRSMYLSKFLVAIGAGLFDAALNYLWDETVAELRRRIADYDVNYFFDVAVQAPDRRKHLKDADDLAKVTDDEMMKAASEIGLISEIGYKQLDLIRYMRNHASAAHPNQNDIGANTLLGWVEVCITHVITLPESGVVAEIKRILVNVKGRTLTPEQAAEIATYFSGLPADQADNLSAGLFGIFMEVTTPETVRDNVRLLLPHLWPRVSEGQRQKFGVKYARYVANGDTDQAQLAKDLLNLLGAAAYLPDEARVPDISSAIEDLLRAHRGFDNFYNEGPRARALRHAVGDLPVPKAVRIPYVKGLVETFLSNGHGVASTADPIYTEMIGMFGREEAEIALLLFADQRISLRLSRSLCQEKWKQLLQIIGPKIATPQARNLYDAVTAFTSTPDKLVHDSDMKRLGGAAADQLRAGGVV